MPNIRTGRTSDKAQPSDKDHHKLSSLLEAAQVNPHDYDVQTKKVGDMVVITVVNKQANRTYSFKKNSAGQIIHSISHQYSPRRVEPMQKTFSPGGVRVSVFGANKRRKSISSRVGIVKRHKQNSTNSTVAEKAFSVVTNITKESLDPNSTANNNLKDYFAEQRKQLEALGYTD